MNSWALFLAAFAALAASAVAEKKIVCYFGSWAVYRQGQGKFDVSNIDPKLCTHLIYSFIGLNNDGSVKVLDPWNDLPDNYGKNAFGRFTKLREQSPNAKIMVAIGGWNEGSGKYSHVAGNPSLRAKFVDSVVNFVRKYKFDGFDLDWEYPAQREGSNPADKKNYVTLVKELKAKLQPHGLLLSAAVAAAEPSASKSYDIAQVGKYLDFVNIMAYDFHGAWDQRAGINAPLYPAANAQGNDLKLNVDAAVKYWLKEGLPASKLILGVPFYGRSFTLANSKNVSPGAAITGPGSAGTFTREPGMLGYNEICASLKKGGWTVVYDKEQRVPYAYKGNQWVGYEDVQSIKEKAEYVKKNNLGGAMLWSIETDDFGGHCGEKYPLLKTLNHVLRNGPAVKPGEPQPQPPATEEPDNRVPTQPPKETPKPDSNGLCKQEGYVRDPQICSKFYYCQPVGESYQPMEFNCPTDLVFDPATNVCNYKDQVSC